MRRVVWRGGLSPRGCADRCGRKEARLFRKSRASGCVSYQKHRASSLLSFLVALCVAGSAAPSRAEGEVQRPISERFAAADVQETPSFQRHVVNLFGRLGCNGRACHGSFQGRGGFELSLFGYDFKADHAALLAKDRSRIDVEHPEQSLILVKPTNADMHEGGQRYEKDSWQYHVFLRWIQSGAKLAEQPDLLKRLDVTPAEIRFRKKGEQVQLKAIAVWEDGTQEDVTPLCRFQTNDEEVAKINVSGQVTAGEPGDTHVVVSYDNGVQPVPVLQPVSELTEANGKYPQVPTPTKVDQLVVAKLRKLGMVPADLCDDAEFLRRVCLDMTGTLPTPQEVEVVSGRQVAEQTRSEDRPIAADALLRRLVDHQAVRLHRQ